MSRRLEQSRFDERTYEHFLNKKSAALRSSHLDSGGLMNAADLEMEEWAKKHAPGLYDLIRSANPFRAYWIGLLDGHSEGKYLAEIDLKATRPRKPSK